MNPIDLLEIGGARRTRLIMQSEESECGLACVAMIASRHGHQADLAALRRRFSISLKGAMLKTLMDIADAMGFVTRPLRVEVEELTQVSLPAMLHWDLNHFVVLSRISRGMNGTKFLVLDPARGELKLSKREFSTHFTGVALEFLPTTRLERRVSAPTMRMAQLWSQLNGLWSSLRSVLLLSLVMQLIALAMPFYLQLAVDTALPSSDLDLLKVLAFGFAGLVVINTTATLLRSIMLVSLSGTFSYQLIVNLCRHMLRLPLPWFERRHVGDIVSRFSSTQPITQLLTQGLIAVAIDGVMAFITLGFMFIYSPLLAGIALGAWAAFAGLKLGLIHTMRMRNIDAISAAARENSAFLETIRGVSAIKAFGREVPRFRSWLNFKADAVNAQIKLTRLSASFDAIGQFILAIERVVFVYIAIRFAMKGGLTVGMVFAFQAYKQQFLDAATRLVEQSVQYKLLDTHLSRLSDIALAEPEGVSDLPMPWANNGGASIELRQLSFRYGTGEPVVFHNINFTVEPGEMIVLVGPSGSGKTTLLKLMMGLFQPTQGRVFVNGQPLDRSLDHWRARCGSVMQDDALFAGTMAENVSFFDADLDMERVYRVARLARIHDDVMAMPLKYDTLVGDMGSTLSGGQKQRVLLARALYHDPQVLFIDEGTAHLDPEVERSIAEVLANLPVTRIMIAHRPQALLGADRLFHVEAGCIRQIASQESSRSSLEDCVAA